MGCRVWLEKWGLVLEGARPIHRGECNGYGVHWADAEGASETSENEFEYITIWALVPRGWRAASDEVRLF